MRVVIAGGRNYEFRLPDVDWLNKFDEHHRIQTVIHGGCRGADEQAGIWARTHDISVEVYAVPDWVWKMVGKKAGPLRNEYMLRECQADGLIAFPGGRGTAHIVALATCLRLPVWLAPVDNPLRSGVQCHTKEERNGEV